MSNSPEYKQRAKARKKERSKLRRLKETVCLGCGVAQGTHTGPAWRNAAGEIICQPQVWLSVHHLVLFSEGGRAEDGVASLCDDCHRAIHTVNDKFKWGHVNPELTAKYLAILAARAAK